MRILDTKKLALMMETTMGSSWLIGLIPLKSLSMKVIGWSFVVVVCQQSWCQCHEWSENDIMELAGLSFVGKCTCNGVDYISNLLGGFLFLWRLLLTFLLVVSLSTLIFCSVSSSFYIMITMLLPLVCSRSYSCLVVARPFNKLG